MDFVNRVKYIITFFTVLLIFKSGAQDSNVNIELRDYHSARITNVVASDAYPYFFTADESGKILAYNSENKRVIKTIKPASGLPITDMKLLFDDRVLTINQKLAFTDGSQDSIISIGVFDQKVLQKMQANVAFIGNQKDAIIIQDTNPDKSLNIVDLYNIKFEKVNRYFVAAQVTMAAYDSITKTMALVEGQVGKQLRVSLQVGNDYKNITKIDIPDVLKIQDLFFDDGHLFGITTNNTNGKVEIYNLSSTAAFSKSIHDIDFDTNFINVSHSERDGLKTIIITANNSFVQPVILEKEGLNFKNLNPKTAQGATQAVYLKATDEILFFEEYHKNIVSSARFAVFDYKKDRIVSSIPKETRAFYSGMFLPNNNWLIYGKALKESSLSLTFYADQLKYFETGTFNNRFGTLSYNDYLEVTHGYSDMSTEIAFDKENGLKPFYGYKKGSQYDNKYGFFVYDIANDKVKELSYKEVRQRSILDYNSITGDLLLSIEVYYNGGHTNPQEFVILNGNTITKLEGKYKFGKFSKNGEFLLLISDKNEAIIKDIKTLKTIFSTELKDGRYKIYADGDRDFLISNSYYQIDPFNCNQSTLTYTISDSNTVETKTLDCLNIIDVASKGDVTVLSVENIGLVIGEKIYKFPLSEFPEKISLNDDGSKLMASFSNGKIKIYTVDGLQPVLEMIHPDKDSHVFVNSDNFYFSNTNPEDYIVSTQDKKLVPIQTLEKDYFNPSEVLKSIGKPNAEYLKLLDEALRLRTANLYENTRVDLEKENSTPKTVEHKKGDLYVLSVGVSDYKQNAYNLTYADKDAFDIAKIYGTVTDEAFQNYKTKFFGNPYTLKDSDDTPLTDINKYFGSYKSLSSLESLTADGYLWLENNYEKNYLWNFKTKTIKAITFPEDVTINTYSVDPIFFPGLDNESFIVKSDNGDFYKYDVKTEKFKKLKLSIKKDDEYMSTDNFTILENDGWAKLSSTSGLNNLLIVDLGNFQTKDTTQIHFNPDIYNIKPERTAIDSANVLLVYLKALSSNGEHLLYSDLDGNSYYKNLNLKDELPLKLKIPKIESLDQLSIAKDGKTFSVIKSHGENFKYKIFKYNLEGDVLDEKVFSDSVKGLSIVDNQLHYIFEGEPLVEERFMSSEDIFVKHTSPSFKSTKVEYLVNEKATSKSIEKTILEVFKNAKPEDQVMLFIAGHGVLDNDLNYYYAPHDMDFNNVSKNGLAFNTIIESLNQSKANNKLLLMDTCHSGNTLDVSSGSKNGVTEGSGQRGSKSRSTKKEPEFRLSNVVSDVFDDFLSKSGITVISASSGADVAYENKALGNGAFTSAYINLLKEKLGGSIVLTEKSLEKSVEFTQDDISELLKQVMQLTNGKQVPDLREINASSNLKMW